MTQKDWTVIAKEQMEAYVQASMSLGSSVEQTRKGVMKFQQQISAMAPIKGPTEESLLDIFARYGLTNRQHVIQEII